MKALVRGFLYPYLKGFRPVQVRLCLATVLSLIALHLMMLWMPAAHAADQGLLPEIGDPSGDLVSRQIINIATVRFDGGANINAVRAQVNVEVLALIDDIEAPPPSPSSIEFLQAVPEATSGRERVALQDTQCSLSGNPAGPFTTTTTGQPVMPGGQSLSIPGIVELSKVAVFRSGSPIFIAVDDADQNRLPNVQERIFITLTVANTGDQEVLALQETAVNSGRFLGFIGSTRQPSTVNDCILSVANESRIIARYVDAFDQQDEAASSALVDPFGVIFSSQTGEALDGASVTLIDVETGAPAQVFGQDGVSRYPSTVISGHTAVDEAQVVYTFAEGQYLFPFVAPGSYQLLVEPPAGFNHPSIVDDAVLQALPGGPFVLVEGSRGEVFNVPIGPAIQIDIPLDPVKNQVFVSKRAARDVVSPGDFLQYAVTLDNVADQGALVNSVLIDRMPLGFRYQSGSARLDQRTLPDPQVSGDGRTLRFLVDQVPAGGQVTVRYVVEVTGRARLGDAINTATLEGANIASSNTAQASVLVREDILRDRVTLMGRVLMGACDQLDQAVGLANVRIFLEDGTFVMSDDQGKWHIEGARPGTHVVQLDIDSLPERYQVTPCERNNRFSGRGYSQFVEPFGGTLWQADFYLSEKPPPVDSVIVKHQYQALGDGAYHVQLRLEHDQQRVPLTELMAVYRLPSGYQLVPDSARVDGRIQAPKRSVIGYSWSVVPGASPVIEFDVTRNGRAIGRAGAVYARYASSQTEKGKTDKDSVRYLEALSGQPSTSQGVAVGSWDDDPNAIAAVVAQTPEKIEGILSLANGEKLVTPINAIRVRLPNKLKPSLWIDTMEVPVERIGFKALDEPQGYTLYSYIGVDFGEPGQRTVTLRGLGPFGNARFEEQLNIQRTGDIKAIKILEKDNNRADGASPLLIKVALLGEDGQAIGAGNGLELISAELKPFNSAQNTAASILGTPNNLVDVDKNGLIKLAPVSRSGLYQAELRYKDMSVPFELYVKPELRDWIVVGMGEGSLGLGESLSGNEQSFDESDSSDALNRDGRVSFYAKGEIRDDWLLTLSYDSKREDERRLKQTVTPGRFFTLYGDQTEQGFDAPSSRNLYLKLEKDRFYTLFGDYDTGLNQNELTRYNRSMTGLKSEYVGQNIKANLFVAENDQVFLRDELLGDGTSGLYRLRGRRLLVNSETVVIETRNRFRSEDIIERRPLTRFKDYSIDYGEGTLSFKSPVFSKDAALNPVFIVVTYETQDAQQRKNLTGGGRLGYAFNERTEVGLTGVRQGDSQRQGSLMGLDVRHDFSDQTQLKIEVARSDTEFDATKESFGPTDQQAGGSGADSGAAYLVELTHDSDRFKAKAYLKSQDTDFGLGQQNQSEKGVRKVGVVGQMAINERLTLEGEAYRQTLLASDADRDVADLRLNLRQERFDGFAGLRFAQDSNRSSGDEARKKSSQLILGGRSRFLDDRLTLGLNADYTFGQKGENSDFPTRIRIGGDYRLTDQISLLAEQEFSFGDKRDTQGTRLGVSYSPWQGGEINTTLERDFNENSDRVFANTGLRQTYQVNPNLSLDFGFDRSQTLKEQGETQDIRGDIPFNNNVPFSSGTLNQDFSALSLGLGYDNDTWHGTSRLELRQGEQEDKRNFFGGFYRDLDGSNTFSATLDYTDVDAKDRDFTRAQVRLGWAYRPFDGKLAILERLDLRYEDQGGLFNSRSRKIVNNFNLNYRPSLRQQLSFQYSFKYLLDTIDGEEFNGYTDLLGAEWRYDLSDRFDIGFRVSRLHSYQSDVSDVSYGAWVGTQVMKNTWVSLGYNFKGFRDQDFDDAEFTAKGFFVKFRFKVDQESIADTVSELMGRF